ncbi:MAG: glycine betaine/L-proline ABC transporter substrate-binding protein ProX [Gammaproteobacteria bacterium]|nr:glycine betaine/L-proline ABC transporter substrate-binding protein ProX [Gammaproteobacteria bacterium]
MNFLRNVKAILYGAAVVPFITSSLVVWADEHKPGEGVTVNMARATWDTGWFQAEVYKQLLEELGYEIPGLITLDNPPFYQAVSQGDVDLWVNGWFPLHNTYEDLFQPGADKIGYVAMGGALQGYLVDKKTAEELDIKTLEDIKRDEVKEALDANGDGKADLVACPPGWGCENVIEHHLDAYNLRDHINPIKAGYSASMADALGRYQNGQPIFFYTWTPNWTVGVLEPGKDVVWLTVEEANLPEDQAYLEDKTTLSGVRGCATDPCNLGWPVNDIRPVANKKFLENNPAAAQLLKEVRIPIQDIFVQNAKMNQGEDSSEDIARHAAEWIADHRDQVDEWLMAAYSCPPYCPNGDDDNE